MVARTKKYDIGINIALRSIAVIVLSLWLSPLVPASAKAQENIQQYEKLKIMVEIDNIGHQRDGILESVGSWYNEKRDRYFHTIDNKYHTVQYRDEKYKAAQELYKLINEQYAFLQGMGKIDTQQKEEFESLKKEIEEIKAQ